MEDIMDTADTKKKPHTTMLEVNDNHQHAEYETTAGSRYYTLFTSFIESLGYILEQDHPHIPENISINGHKFYINADNASYMSKQAYTRVTAVRKDVNRYIKLTISRYKSPAIITIRFNKEYSVDALKKKIDKAIADEELAIENANNKKQIDKEYTTAVAMAYASRSCAAYLSDIRIHKGTVTLYIKELGQLELKINGELIGLNIYSKTATHLDGINTILESIGAYKETINNIIHSIKDMKPMTSEIQEWAVTAYERRFSITNMAYSE